MGTVLVYIQFSIFDEIYKNKENIFILISFIHFCSSLFIFIFRHTFFLSLNIIVLLYEPEGMKYTLN